MPQIEVQVRLPTAKGVWRWYEHLDDGEDLAELLRRVVKYDAQPGSTVKTSQTLWLRAFELRVKLVARFDAAAGCYRTVRSGNPWVGCYDREERVEGLGDRRAFLHRRFLNAKRESKVGYTEADRAAGARERDDLQRQLDALAAEKAAVNAEDPREAQPPLFPARTLAQAGFTDKCIVFVEHRGVVSATPGYLLPDLADFRKGSMDALRATMEAVRASADADALARALEECIAMGLDKSDALAEDAFALLATTTKLRDAREDALDDLRSLLRLARAGHTAGADVYKVSEAVERARAAGVPADHVDLAAAAAVLCKLQVEETERLRVAAVKQGELDDLVDYCTMNQLSEAIAAHVQALGHSLETMHRLKAAEVKAFADVPFKDKKRFGALMKQLARARAAAV